jgi:LuxR family maltose regulon positive regulatory protein
MSIPARDGTSAGSAARGGIIPRRKLLDRLDEAARVTQISAPPGSGKTSLLRSWIERAGVADSVAWVSARSAERDPQWFWISLAGKLRGTAPGSALIQPLTAAPEMDSWDIVERLLTDLAALDQQLWLIIDDLNQLRSGEALRQLELFLLRAPQNLRFVLATRRDMRLGLHRLRLEGELTEIRAADLRFTLEEARELFATSGVELPEPALKLLHQRTEGWAAGLRLAALSLAGHPAPERFAEEFSGTERMVADYLLAEVLERQPAPVRQLLLRTSILDRVCGELADLLTGDAGGERILQDLEEAGAFVVSLDTRRSWFRYHRLFADLLQLELRRTATPDEVTGLHRAAAGWFACNGDVVEAIRHAQGARDWAMAARLLADHSIGLYLDGQAGNRHDLLAAFPADVVTANAELAALLASDELLRGSPDGARRYLALAASQSESVAADRRGRLQTVLAILRLSLAQGRGDLPAVAKEAQPLLAAAENPDVAQRELGADLRAVALVNLGIAELWALRADDAERHLEQGSMLAQEIGRPWLETNAVAHWAWAASFRSFALAVQRCTQAIELAGQHGWAGEPAVVVAYTALGAIRVWQVRLAEAETLLDQASLALRPRAEPAAGLVLHQARGMLALARGRDEDALAAFRTGDQLASLLVTSHPRPTPMRAHMVQTLVRLGETGRAEAALAELDEEQRERGEMRVATAALLFAQHEPRAATDALTRVLDGSAPVTNLGWLTQAFLLEAIARNAIGDPVAASSALERALDLAEPDGVLFAFLLNPAPELLRRHAQGRTAHAALIAQILSLLAGNTPALPHSDRRTTAGELGLREPLTGSQLRLLRYLPTNLSVPEIAAEVSLSVNTVRTHVRHLYEKLGAHSRTDAVERARALGLLAPSARRG